MRNYLSLAALLIFSLSAIAQTENSESLFCREKCHYNNHIGIENINYFQYPSMNKYDVKYLKLDIAVEPNNRNIAGSALTRVIALQTMDSFICELRNNMIVDSVFINGVKITTFTKSADHVFVPLSPAITAGTTINALFYYRGLASSNGIFAGSSSTLTYTASLSESYQAREWFPVKQILSDKIDSADIWLTTTNPNLAGSNGLLVGTVDLPSNKKQFRWKTKYPQAYYLPSFSVGNYMDYSHYAKPVSIAPDSILVQHYIANNATFFNNNKPNLDKTPPFVEKQSELYGIYPFWQEKYGHCHANIGGGMEHQTMSTMGSFGTTIIAHELGHQWFGDNVTCATWNHIWLNEGFASYTEYLMIEHLPALHPGLNTVSYMNGIHTNVMSQNGGSVFVPDASIFDENRIFSNRLTYDKGSAIIHTLRGEIRDDNLFYQVLRNYQQQYGGSTATAENFKAVAEATCGRTFDDYFTQWYYGEGYPTFNVDYSKVNDSLVLFVAQTVSMPSVTPFFKGFYEFTIKTVQGDTVVRVNQTVNGQTFKFRSTRTPNGVVVDPNNWVLNKIGTITTGINDPVNVSNKVIIYPNPSIMGNVTLKYPMGWFNKLQVFDITGKLVLEENVIPGSSQKTLTNSLVTGTYVVQMSGKGRVAIKKFVVAE